MGSMRNLVCFEHLVPKPDTCIRDRSNYTHAVGHVSSERDARGGDVLEGVLFQAAFFQRKLYRFCTVCFCWLCKSEECISLVQRSQRPSEAIHFSKVTFQTLAVPAGSGQVFAEASVEI